LESVSWTDDGSKVGLKNNGNLLHADIVDGLRRLLRPELIHVIKSRHNVEHVV
jgi:hypothetical protein